MAAAPANDSSSVRIVGPDEAGRLAKALIGGLGDRWLHAQSVAARAVELGDALAEADRRLLVAAAWLHDIGYSPVLAVSGFHPLDGALDLRRREFAPRLVALVAHHSGARFEAQLRGLSDELAEFAIEDSPVADALAAADLLTGPRGRSMSFDERLDEILTRYQAGSTVHEAMSAARPILAAQVRRALSRIGQPM